ncbi:hypothetical protein DH86_00001369, partial [Scytalidium sp. 3C]
NTFTNVIYCYYAYRGITRNSGRPDAFIRNLSYLGLIFVGQGDDLSMLVATGLVMHRVFTFDKTPKYTLVYGVVLSAVVSLFIAWHCIMDETTVHSIFFAVMMITVSRKTRRLMAENIKDRRILGQLRDMACAKRAIGMPWSFILEFHGWWHIFTGIGAYVLIAVVEYVTSEDAGKPLDKNFAWPVGWIIESSHTKSGSGNGNASLDKKKSK